MLERTTNKRRASASARTRRYRARQAKGETIVPVPVSHEIIALLVDLRWLPESESEDRRRIGESIFKMLSDTAKNR